ncbi:MAG: 5'-methylthioadenosine nucleosidase, partial [Planctomycetota bacterium]|nr:5'-methylthioadenosine nucleosidase [Planctomycetota bacterium]
VCALAIEINPFLNRCERPRKYTGGNFVFRGGIYDGIRVAIVQSGVGFAKARQATQAMIDAHRPSWIISAGFSGALQPQMKIGDIVVGTSLVDTHGQELKIDMQMPADPAQGLHVGRLVTADAIVRTVEEKKQLAERHQGLAVDLESLAVAQVCRADKIPCLAVRVISDDLSSDLPVEVNSVVASTGTRRLGAAIGAIWKRPESVKDMWHLRESATKSAEKLATFLDGIVIQLYREAEARAASNSNPAT